MGNTRGRGHGLQLDGQIKVLPLGPLFAAEQRRAARGFGRALGELGKHWMESQQLAPEEPARVESVRELRRPPGWSSSAGIPREVTSKRRRTGEPLSLVTFFGEV